jgi:rare lipoprotein A
VNESARRNRRVFPSYPGRMFCWAAALLLVAGCASSPRFTRSRSTETTSKDETSPAKSLKTIVGVASYYAEDFNGKKTANGEVYDMYKMTAAHRSFPFNTKVKVTNLENKRSIVVRINDRGPFKLDRIIDLSLAAATQLGMKGSGTAKVRLEVVEWGDEEYSK